MVEKAKAEFIELMTDSGKAKGFDELSSKIWAILYAEPKELSLDELSKRTGYCLSAVSTAMKFMERAQLIKRIKKPKSRKAYFYIEKDILNSFMQLLKRHYNTILLPSKQKLPKIIDRYRQSKESKEELIIVQNYYDQILAYEKIVDNTISMLEKEINPINK